MDKNSREFEFVMSFVSASDQYRKQYISKWQEILYNFMVEPYQSVDQFTSPYRRYKLTRQSRTQILLKDPETHKAIMTYASKLVRTVLGDRKRQYIQARPRGWEDAARKAPTVSRLIGYAFSLPGHFRTMVEAVVDMLLFGTSVIEIPWEYQEREVPAREIYMDEFGNELETISRVKIPSYDDVKLRVIDVLDFYPDPGRYRIQDMSGAVKRFKMNAIYARYMAQSGIYDRAAVERAIESGNTSALEGEREEDFQKDITKPRDAYQQQDFKDMIGYEYWGEVPWVDDFGSSRRVITLLNGVVVRSKPYPLADPALPFHSLIINPIQGRFYGVSPAEVIRFDQEYADAVKVLLAEAIIRQVHPPIAFDPDSDLDVAAMKAWKADAPIAVRGGPNSIGTLRYQADINAGFAMLTGLKNSMQEASGALGGIQGEPGPDREAASVGVQRIQMALDRPELAAMILEQECLPPIGKAILRRYQQFLSGTEDLKLRIGEMPEPVWIGDIMGDFDIEFVGSRVAMSRQEKLLAYDRLTAMVSAVPALAARIPWDEVGIDMIGDVLELPEVAAKVSNPQTMALNMLLQQLGSKQPGGGVQAAEPPGMIPAQSSGMGPV